jgi:hypothetical protein
MKINGLVVIGEPKGHVSNDSFAATLAHAQKAGFELVGSPTIRRSLSAVMRKTGLSSSR